jgi:hypothetical protein
MSIVAILFLFLLLFCSALISGTEVAFFSLSKTDIIKIQMITACYWSKCSHVAKLSLPPSQKVHRFEATPSLGFQPSDNLGFAL